jgi:hypothetical protein
MARHRFRSQYNQGAGQGRNRFEVDVREVLAGPGAHVYAPYGTRNAFQNFGTELAIVTVFPGGLDLFFEEIGANAVPGNELPLLISSARLQRRAPGRPRRGRRTARASFRLRFRAAMMRTRARGGPTAGERLSRCAAIGAGARLPSRGILDRLGAIQMRCARPCPPPAPNRPG